jgi:DNA-3-methyladenine glycosylase I
MKTKKEPIRCGWAGSEAVYIRYHDQEWGVAVHDDRKFFEMLTLEGAQAGLSWITILKKRENYRKAFRNFNPELIAAFTPGDIRKLLANAGIIRNRLKIESTVTNARAFLEVRKEFGSFDSYVWQFVGKPRMNTWNAMKDVPSSTPESDAMSKDLRKRGFRFVGTTICYSFMQATGMVNDHLTTCFRHREITKLSLHR